MSKPSSRDAARSAPTTNAPIRRCDWGATDPLMQAYHDTEWGVPVHDDRRHFEFLLLEGAQAGLSWLTVLRKREAYRRAFAQFDAAEVAAYGEKEIARLLSDPGIIRNRLKVRAAVTNAAAFLKLQQEFGTFDAYVWSFVKGKPIRNKWRSMKKIPPRSPESDALSRDLIRRGFKFVGSTIVYAHLQATGLVNDHLIGCFRYNAPV